MGAGTQKSSGEGTQVLNTVTLHLSRNKENQVCDSPLSFDSVVKSPVSSAEIHNASEKTGVTGKSGKQ